MFNIIIAINWVELVHTDEILNPVVSRTKNYIMSFCLWIRRWVDRNRIAVNLYVYTTPPGLWKHDPCTTFASTYSCFVLFFRKYLYLRSSPNSVYRIWSLRQVVWRFQRPAESIAWKTLFVSVGLHLGSRISVINVPRNGQSTDTYETK